VQHANSNWAIDYLPIGRRH